MRLEAAPLMLTAAPLMLQTSKHMMVIRDRELGLRLKEVMMCLRLPLTSSSEELRASSLKVVR